MRGKQCLLLVLMSAPLSEGCAPTRVHPPDSVEAEIRRLDHAEAQALLQRDSTTLRRLWANDFTVNNPRGGITRGSNEVVALIRNGIIDYSAFDRQIEVILPHGASVIVMGSERIVPGRKAPLAGQRVLRRFTHFWMKRNGEWRLTARHANVVTQN